MEETRLLSDETILLQGGIDKLNSGDASVRGEILNIACAQLMQLTGQLKREFDELDHAKQLNKPLDDLFAGVTSRLYEALYDAKVRDIRHFFQIASRHIRREMIDLCGRTGTPGSPELAELATFHRCVDSLTEPQREVFELIHYHERTREEVASILDISVPEVKRFWRSARLELHDRLEYEGRTSGGSQANSDSD